MKPIYYSNINKIPSNYFGVICYIIMFLVASAPVFAQSSSTDKNNNQEFSGNEIFDAINEEDYSRIEILLENNKNLVFLRNEEGKTPLLLASRGIRYDIFELLVSYGSPINVKDINGITPLHSVAYRGNMEATWMLLSKGADINARHNEGGTPLHCASYQGHKEIAGLLLEKGADINAKENQGMTPLQHAVYNEQFKVVELLIKNGAQVNTLNENNWSPLHFAAENGNKKITSQLIAFEVLLNAQEKTGKTALHIAVKNNNKDIIKLLLSKGIKTDITDQNGRTALMNAILDRQTDIARLLISKGADINTKEKYYSRTCLHLAAISGNEQITKFLISNKAIKNIKDKSGFTPLYYAAKYGHKNIFNLLIEKGAEKDNLVISDNQSEYLNKILNKNEAFVWYLGHCGWAVKTRNYLLIFDYWKTGPKPNFPTLSNGNINPDEIKDLNVIVFVSHSHGDHFDETIFEWENEVKNISYVFGWDLKHDPGYFCLTDPRESLKIDGVEIFTIYHSFDGIPEVAYLVKTDSLTIYFSGDHGSTGDELNPMFRENINYLSELENKVDIAFISSFGSSNGEIVNKGDLYTFEKLNPEIIYPMHLGGNEHIYKEFASELDKKKSGYKVCCAENPGDRSFYFYNKK